MKFSKKRKELGENGVDILKERPKLHYGRRNRAPNLAGLPKKKFQKMVRVFNGQSFSNTRAYLEKR